MSSVTKVQQRVAGSGTPTTRRYPEAMNALEPFSPATRAWFENAFAEPTPAQTLGWPAIASGANTLIQAPTGSGKTLAAFLYGIDRLDVASPRRAPQRAVRRGIGA